MTQTQQPKALRLAHALSGGKLIDDSTEWADTLHAADAELRHQHARIAELEAQLSAIGAGGVEPLRKQARPRTPQREGVMRNWTVARYPNGSWITGGRPDDPDYAECEVWVIDAETRDAAKRKAQAKRAYEKNRLKSKQGGA